MIEWHEFPVEHPDNFVEWPESRRDLPHVEILIKHTAGHHTVDLLHHPKTFARQHVGILSLVQDKDIEKWALPFPIINQEGIE